MMNKMKTWYTSGRLESTKQILDWDQTMIHLTWMSLDGHRLEIKHFPAMEKLGLMQKTDDVAKWTCGTTVPLPPSTAYMRNTKDALIWEQH